MMWPPETRWWMRAVDRTEHAEGVDIDRLGHPALAEQLRRHVWHRPEALRADVRRAGRQDAADAKVRKPAQLTWSIELSPYQQM